MNKLSRLAFPYLIWMIIIVVLPLGLMVVLSFLDISGIDFKNATFSLANFKNTFTPTYIEAYFRSIILAAITTVICLLLGYPVSYIISKSNIRNKYLILLILILPMWTNMLLRIQTLNRILLPEGFLKNTLGISIDLSSLRFGTEISVILAMVMMYLPFMIFPIYTVLEKIEPSLLEASQDLGASKIKTFRKVTLPLSFKGISSGIIMVFLPCAMGFTIPEIMSGGKMILIGTIIEQKFKQGTAYNIGSLISLVVIIVVLLALWIIGKIDEEGETLL